MIQFSDAYIYMRHQGGGVFIAISIQPNYQLYMMFPIGQNVLDMLNGQRRFKKINHM